MRDAVFQDDIKRLRKLSNLLGFKTIVYNYKPPSDENGYMIYQAKKKKGSIVLYQHNNKTQFILSWIHELCHAYDAAKKKFPKLKEYHAQYQDRSRNDRIEVYRYEKRELEKALLIHSLAGIKSVSPQKVVHRVADDVADYYLAIDDGKFKRGSIRRKFARQILRTKKLKFTF